MTNGRPAHSIPSLFSTAIRAVPALVVLAAWLLGSAGAGAASGPAGKAVFAGADGVYVLTADGLAPRRVWTSSAGSAREPRWSHDGARIAFVGPDGNVWLMGADGSAAHALTSQGVAPSGCGEDVCTNPGVAADSVRWSGDGSTISYRLVDGVASGSIWTVLAAGGPPSRVASASDLCIFNEGFSPSGDPLYSRCAAAAGPSNATYLAVSNGGSRPLLAGSQIAYSPDGARVAFSSQATSGDGLVVSLYVAAADGSGAQVVARDGQNPAWSRSGVLAYQVGGADGWTIHVYEPTTAADSAVTTGQLAGWTSDGGWLYFTRTDAAGTSIWILRADGTGATQIAQGDSPDWAS